MKYNGLFALTLAAAGTLGAANLTTGMQPGKADLKSAGPLAFGPDGILLVGDPIGAQIFAIATGDTKAVKGAATADLPSLNEKIAAHLGSSADQILVNDMAVNPVSKAVYLSVQRGRGPEAQPVLLRVRDGKVEDLKLDSVLHSSAALPNAPADVKDQRGNSKRAEAITDIAYLDGKVIVAGLSNEEFASTLRTLDFPFAKANTGSTSVEIFHGAHGRYETNAPVRTFTSYQIGNKSHLLAAYTCTPLVKIPLSDLKAGSKIMGTTIAELGNGNRPLDMIVYKKGGADFILMNNSRRGVMKLSAANLDTYQPITKPTDVAGVPYETIAAWKGVEQLDRFDDSRALMLVRADSGALDLKTVALP